MIGIEEKKKLLSNKSGKEKERKKRTNKVQTNKKCKTSFLVKIVQ